MESKRSFLDEFSLPLSGNSTISPAQNGVVRFVADDNSQISTNSGVNALCSSHSSHSSQSSHTIPSSSSFSQLPCVSQDFHSETRRPCLSPPVTDFDLSLPNLQDVMEEDAPSHAYLMSSTPTMPSFNPFFSPTMPSSSYYYEHPFSARSPSESSFYALNTSFIRTDRPGSVDYSLSHDSYRWNGSRTHRLPSGTASPSLLSPYSQPDLKDSAASLPISPPARSSGPSMGSMGTNVQSGPSGPNGPSGPSGPSGVYGVYGGYGGFSACASYGALRGQGAGNPMGLGALSSAEPGSVAGMAGLPGAEATHPSPSPRPNANGNPSPRSTSSSKMRVNAHAHAHGNIKANANTNGNIKANANGKGAAGASHLGPTESDKSVAARVLNASNAPSDPNGSAGHCPTRPAMPSAAAELKPSSRSSRKWVPSCGLTPRERDRDRDAKPKRASRQDAKASDDLQSQSQSQSQGSIAPRSKPKAKSKAKPRPDSDREQVELKGLRGHVVEMAKNYNGCRALQQILLAASPAVVTEIFEELQGSLRELMKDPFGNYVFQMLLQVCSEERRAQIVLLDWFFKGSSLQYASS